MLVKVMLVTSLNRTKNGAPITCPNCESIRGANWESPVAPGRFCSECGQRLALAPLRLRELVATTWSNVSSLEGPILATVRCLLTGPGRTARAWIDGKRTRYLNPVKFLFVVSLIIALSYEPIMAARQAMQVPGSAIYTVGLEAHSPVFSLFGMLLPVVIAVAITAVGRLFRLGLPWLDWYVLGAYAIGMGALLQLTFKLVALPLPASWSGWLAVAEFALPVALLAWGSYHMVARNRRWQAVLVALLATTMLGLVLGAVAT